MNFVSIISKFTLDALTNANVWEDDNDSIVKNEIIKPTIYGTGEAYCEITIEKF
ncbi:MAG: hypothetical protein GY827_08455 [Cytophagales bacterium]|nr:hypothetical protein [Cytophagales bacterium]